MASQTQAEASPAAVDSAAAGDYRILSPGVLVRFGGTSPLAATAMDEQRRYRDDEIEAIFQRAASPAVGRGGPAPSGEGLTLAELQAIGREVGLPPEKVAEAAATLDQRGDRPRLPALLGMPGSVHRTVQLPRLPSDREWELLLGDLRATFAARGRVGSRGSL